MPECHFIGNKNGRDLWAGSVPVPVPHHDVKLNLRDLIHNDERNEYDNGIYIYLF
jgi:hypothetical protein